MRIPGLATGMDTDSMVKEMMKPYQMKVDRVKQDNLRIKYQQDLYRDVLKQSQDFYNKYFSISSKDSLMSSSNWQTVGFTSSNDNAVTATGSAGSQVENYSVKVKSVATSATAILEEGHLYDGPIEIQMDGKTITVPVTDTKGNRPQNEIIDDLNKQFKDNKLDLKVTKSDFYKGLEFKTSKTGTSASFKINGTDAKGTNASVEITKNGVTKEFNDLESNTLTLDGIKFEFHDVTTEAVRLTGKNDVTKTKDLIVNFVNDYNKLIENMNKQLLTKHDKSYTPLTDEQRKDMSEDQQKLWDKKAKEGLLKGDMNLDRINDKLKGIMRTNFGGMNLEKIGIIPVNNYGEQNGMFTIDEFKLEEALEKNPGEVKDLFLRQPVDDKDPSTGGILSKMKDTLYNETVSVSSPLMKKAGMEGSVTAFNNELTTTMEKKQKIIAEMERDLATRENNYYLQFSRLETQMNKLNSQNAYLMAQLGGGK